MKINNLFESSGVKPFDKFMNWMFLRMVNPSNELKFNADEAKNSSALKNTNEYLDNFYEEDGKINFNSPNNDVYLFLDSFHSEKMPTDIKFGKINARKFVIRSSDEITGVEPWFPEYLSGALVFRDLPNLKSLSKIDKVVKRCDRIEFVKCKVDECLLGVMRIADLGEISDMTPHKGGEKKDFAQAIHIISENLIHGDIFSAQDELINAGLERFAKL